jgi:hypothetical protein
MNLKLSIGIFMLLISCGHSPSSPSFSPSPKSFENVTCKLDQDIRKIELHNFKTAGCDLRYTKFNTVKSVAKANAEKNHCLEVSKKIVNNLTQSGFLCE